MNDATHVITQHLSNTPTGLHWTAYLTAVVVPIIALVAAWVAFRQAQIARNKLKLELYDKRIVIYDIARQTLGLAAARGSLTQEDEVNYLSGIRSARWLLGPEVVKYLDGTLWRKIVELGLHNSMSAGPPSDERTKHVNARAETLNWLAAQYKELDRIVAKYLTLEH